MNYSDKTEVLNLDEIKIKKLNKKKVFFRIIPIIMIPFLVVLTIISIHSKKLVIVPINYVVYILLSFFVYLLLIGFFLVKKNKTNKSKKQNTDF